VGVKDKKGVLKQILSTLKVINQSQALDIAGQLGVDGFGERKKDLIPFLMDLLSMLAGGKSLEDMLKNILGTKLESIDQQVRNSLRDGLKSKCGESVLNSGFPAWLGGGGLEINLVNLDIFDFLKTVQGMGGMASPYANQVLSGADDFNRKIMEAVDELNSAKGLTIAGKEIAKVTYTGGGFIFEIGVDYTNKNVENFIDDYFDNLQLFPIEAIVNALVDLLTGIFTKKSGKSFETIMEMQQMNATINRMADTDCGEIVNEEFAFFTYDRNDMELFRHNAEKIIRGVTVMDLNCGTLVTSVDESDVNSLISRYSSLYLDVTLTQRQRTEAIGNLIDGLSSLAISGQIPSFSNVPSGTNEETIKGGIIQMLLDNLKNVFLKQALTPQTLIMLLLIGYALVDDSELEDQGSGQPKKIDIGPERLEIFGDLRGSIREIVKILYELIVKNFFENLSRFVQQIMADIAIKILKEKLALWTASIKATLLKGKAKIAQRTKRIL